LNKLHRARAEFVPLSELCAESALTAGDVAAEVELWRKLGYVIEAHPHHGYRLVQTPDRLIADDLRSRLNTKIIGSEIIVFQQTTSTNDAVLRLGCGGFAEGLVVFAETQTAGRGRHGRVWSSPNGKGLWFSVLLRPLFGAAAAGRITVAASVAVAQALRHVGGVDARIKWPNDIVVNGRKLVGILTEWQGDMRPGPFAALGIGIDVNCRREDFPVDMSGSATSLLIETGAHHDRSALAAEILSGLDRLYRASHDQFDDVVSQWASLNMTLGHHLTVRIGTRTCEGFAQGLDGDGALLLRRDNGQIERILSGDIVKAQGSFQ
jgi:BirA family biotin operon repressor/biotin-[acetyl-CoA-carboxylase] ligase